MDDCRSKYKAAITTGEGRRRRQDEMTQIRKNKREESLKKRRIEEMEDDQSPNPEMLLAEAAGIHTDDSNMQLEATTRFRILLNMASSAVFEEVILAASRSGIVLRFMEFLTRDDYPQLQFEAAWVLTNIAFKTSETTQVVTIHVVVPIFVKLLDSPIEDVREQAVWALGNVASESPIYRDLVVAHDALSPLLALLNGEPKLSLLRTVTWTLSTFFMGRPQPVFEQIRPALLALERLINSNDKEVLTDACLALSHLSDCTNEDCTNEEIQAIIEANFFDRIVELLSHPSSSVIIPALTTVGNIASGDDLQTQAVKKWETVKGVMLLEIMYIIDHQALPSLHNLLAHNFEKGIKKEACWTISNITAGNEDHIQAVFDANIIDPLVKLIHTADFDVKKEAAWAICNGCWDATDGQIKYLVSHGCIQALCDLLDCRDETLVGICLEGLDNILRVGEDEKILGTTEGVNLYAKMVEDAEGLDKIENLHDHANTEIYFKALKIIEAYWFDDDEFIEEWIGRLSGR